MDSVKHLESFFEFGHLPDHLKKISQSCAVLADEMIGQLDNDNPELIAGLRKLLEAKDCFVRARLSKDRADG